MRTILLLLSFLFTATLVKAQLKVENVVTHTLNNGMKLILLEDHSIPNITMYLFWRVGSRNEVPGITGLSHFFEHMMFNGAKKYGPHEFDNTMEANGGSNNAYTSENVTVYTNWFPSNASELIFDLEADRIGKLAFVDSMIESERGVILSERITSLENSNWDLLEEQVKSVAFIAHPYRWSVVGYESDIKNWSRQDLEKYFQTYYAPNNGVVVLVGDFVVADMIKLAQHYFEPIPAQKPPRPVHTVEPEQLGEKRLWVKKDVMTPNVMIVFHTPETKHPDYYAVDILNSILSEGRSSRLYRALVDQKQLATEVTSAYPIAFDPNLLFIYAVCSEDADEIKVEQAINEEIAKIIHDGISTAELQKVINRKLVEFYHNIETIDGKANNLGTYELFFGDYRKLFSAPKEYEKVTVEDIKRVAATYLKRSNRTVGILKKNQEE
jgi:zinc protease